MEFRACSGFEFVPVLALNYVKLRGRFDRCGGELFVHVLYPNLHRRNL
jgi:hypothetical protein